MSNIYERRHSHPQSAVAITYLQSMHLSKSFGSPSLEFGGLKPFARESPSLYAVAMELKTIDGHWTPLHTPHRYLESIFMMVIHNIVRMRPAADDLATSGHLY